MSAAFQGRTVVITGSSSGIGRAVAERFGAGGAHVYVTGRTPQAMAEVGGRIEAAGGRATLVTLDVRDHDAVRTLVERAAAETGRLDVMVNNAGISHPGPILDQDPEMWREMLDVNVLALLVGSQAAVGAMRRLGSGGHVVNVSSIAARHHESGVYGATKHAVNAITESLRRELEDDDIRVTSVMPGPVATNFARNFSPETIRGMGSLAGVEIDWQQGERIPDWVLEKAQAGLERVIASPDDIAGAVVYAVSAPLRLNVAEIVVRPAKAVHFN